METNLRPDNVLYFVDQEGAYQVLKNKHWDLADAEEFIVNEIEFAKSCALKSEIQLKELNINWLNKQLEHNLDSTQANLVYYSLGYFRVYKLTIKE